MIRDRSKIRLVYLALLFMIIAPLSTGVAEGQIEIGQTPSTTFPILINQPGNYLLISDLIISVPNTHGLQIDTNDVALDLNGHSIIGPEQESCTPETGVGIYAAQKNNITVIHGTVQGFCCGLNLSGANHEVKDIHASSNHSQGIRITASLISNCTASNNGSDGIAAESCTITDCTANDNSSLGFDIDSSTLFHCTAERNGSHGIYTTGKCRLEGCTLRDNQGYGLFLSPDYSYAIKNGAGQNTLGNFHSDGHHYLPTDGDNANYEF